MKSKRTWLLVTAAVVAVSAAALFLWYPSPQGSLSAQVRSQVGYVDWDLILSSYAGDAISAVLAERDRLQGEFDSQASELDEAGRRALFEEYERRLAAYEHEMGIERLMSDIDAALSAVAAENGVTVILDPTAVVWGGVDLTGPVLRRLGVLD